MQTIFSNRGFAGIKILRMKIKTMYSDKDIRVVEPGEEIIFGNMERLENEMNTG